MFFCTSVLNCNRQRENVKVKTFPAEKLEQKEFYCFKLTDCWSWQWAYDEWRRVGSALFTTVFLTKFITPPEIQKKICLLFPFCRCLLQIIHSHIYSKWKFVIKWEMLQTFTHCISVYCKWRYNVQVHVPVVNKKATHNNNRILFIFQICQDSHRRCVFHLQMGSILMIIARRNEKCSPFMKTCRETGNADECVRSCCYSRIQSNWGKKHAVFETRVRWEYGAIIQRSHKYKCSHTDNDRKKTSLKCKSGSMKGWIIIWELHLDLETTNTLELSEITCNREHTSVNLPHSNRRVSVSLYYSNFHFTPNQKRLVHCSSLRWHLFRFINDPYDKWQS